MNPSFESNFISGLYHQIETLIPQGARFAIGFSGGGDSLALLHALRHHPARPLVLIVDHDLQKGSEKIARTAARQARHFGYECHILCWQHDHPRRGLQEKARHARYHLMGDICREFSIAYLVLAHTQDDQSETLLMRYQRQTDWRGAAGMMARTYSPVWPQLAGIYLIRPLLDVRRTTLRAYNLRHGLNWHEDVMNEDLRWTRIQARVQLHKNPHWRDNLLTAARDLQAGRRSEQRRLARWCVQNVQFHDGYVCVQKLPPSFLFGSILRAVGGSGRIGQADKLARLLEAMGRTDFRSMTLWGTQVCRVKDGFLVMREPVFAKGRRGGHAPIPAMPVSSTPYIWDGRYQVNSDIPGLSICPGYAYKRAQLTAFSSAVKTIPPKGSLSLPVLADANGDILAIGHTVARNYKVEGLLKTRLMAEFSV